MYGAEYDDISRSLVMAIIGVKPTCRQCGGELSMKSQISFKIGKRVECHKCGWYGNWRYGTVLESSRLSNIQFLALFFKYTLPADAPAIGKQIGLDPATVRDWREKILTLVRGTE